MGDANRGGTTSDPAELADADQAGQPATDDDFAEPGGDAPITTPADTSRVGGREPGDADDIGSTDAMTSSTGGLAGSSR